MIVAGPGYPYYTQPTQQTSAASSQLRYERIEGTQIALLKPQFGVTPTQTDSDQTERTQAESIQTGANQAGSRQSAAPAEIAPPVIQFDQTFFNRQAQTAFAAQEIAQQQDSENAEETPVEQSAAQAAVSAFRKIVNMSPEERLFELLLKKRGLTPEELAALPPDEREKIIAEIKAEIKEKVEKKAASTGESGTENTAAVQTSGDQAVATTVQSDGTLSVELSTAQGRSAALTDLGQIAQQRSPSGKVGFDDILAVLGQGQQFLAKLNGEVPLNSRTADQDRFGNGRTARRVDQFT